MRPFLSPPRKAFVATFSAAAEYAYSGKYPLARFLLLYVNYKPGSKLDPLREEFVKLIFSKQGQASVIKDGYFPISARIAQRELAKLGMSMKNIQ